MEYRIETYVTSSGKRPFREWLDDLSDMKARAAIDLRIERLEMGNFGKCEPVGEGVFELKFKLGPGYRVYFSKVGSCIILLLCAGDKGSQKKDIVKAKEYFQDYKIRG